MFDFTISITNIIAFFGIVFSGAWAFFKVKEKADTAQKEAELARIEAKAAQKSNDDLRLEMVREYASVTHLKEVEVRLAASVESLANEIRTLREYLMRQKSN